MTAAGSPDSCEMTVTLLRSPQVCSCSRAAARKVSPAASRTDLPCAWKYLASLPIEVVLPAPLTPAIMMMKGAFELTSSGTSSGSKSSCSASASACWIASGVSSFSRLARALSASSRWVVASRPTSLVSSRVSSSSSSSSSTLPREKIDLSLPPNWARVRDRPASRRSRHEGAGAAAAAGAVSAGGADFLRKPNMGWRVFRGLCGVQC